MKVRMRDECCGSSFKTDQVSFFGLLTLSVPVIASCAVVYSLLLPFSSFGLFRNFAGPLSTIIRANLKLFRKQSFLPGVRCAIAAKLLRPMPRISKYAYDQFNLIVASMIWTVVIAGLILVV